jgi:hypothetical protein
MNVSRFVCLAVADYLKTLRSQRTLLLPIKWNVSVKAKVILVAWKYTKNYKKKKNN